jgi:hypothetical protein
MTSEWQNVLRTQWGIDACLTKLPGEYNLNFRCCQTNENTHHIAGTA